MIENKTKKEESNSIFNMANDTLQRCGEILREIKTISTTLDFSKEEKQEIKIDLTKQFFLQISPLLSEIIVNKYKDKILNLTPIKNRIFETQFYGEQKFIGLENVFSEELEFELNKLLLVLQRELQKEGKYLMQTTTDLKVGWGTEA